MRRSSGLRWVICLLTVTALVRLGAAQTFLYSKLSCVDLVPRHSDAVAAAAMEETNHVKQNAEAGKNGTSSTPTTAKPPPEVGRYTGSVTVNVLPSEERYRRLKKLVVRIQSRDYFNGFMIQARRLSAERTRTPEVVGRFLQIPHRGEYLTCPNGTEIENTVVNEDAPLRLSNLSFTWMAPEVDKDNIEFVASVLLENGEQYKVYNSRPLDLNMYPVSTKDCAVAKSCFRYCMKRGGKQCEAHMSRYMASLEFLKKKTEVKITLGGQLPEPEGYLAVGFSQDARRLSDADISVCYRTEENTVEVEHYILKSTEYPPDLHQGILQLDSQDIDGDYVWCTFTRPLTGDSYTMLDLSEPTYYFYFWGMRNGSVIFLPKPGHIKRSRKMISLKDELFNEILSSGAPRHPPFTIVAAGILVGVFHTLW